MNTVAEYLSNLIRIPSVSTLSNRSVIDYTVEVLHQAKWQTKRLCYRDTAGVEKVNLIAAPSDSAFDDFSIAELAFVCHTDTVPYSPNWKAATEPVIVDGVLYGCGACDVKGFLACLLTAASEVDSSKLLDGIRIVLTADEEIGCVGASKLVEAGLIRTKRMVVGEPTRLHPARAGKGYCLAHITVFGHEAHSAHPERGKSAIVQAARLIIAIEELGSRLTKERNSFFEPGFTTLNVGTIRGGTAKNIIAGECFFELEWRPIPGNNEDAVPTELCKIVNEMKVEDPNFRCDVQMLREQAGFETPQNAELVRLLEKTSGRKAISIPFASEASLLAPAVEEIVVFGPGDMRTAHSERECVSLHELDLATACLKSLMTNLNG